MTVGVTDNTAALGWNMVEHGGTWWNMVEHGGTWWNMVAGLLDILPPNSSAASA